MPRSRKPIPFAPEVPPVEYDPESRVAESALPFNIPNLVGRTFGIVVVDKFMPRLNWKSDSNPMYECRCTRCGRTRPLSAYYIYTRLRLGVTGLKGTGCGACTRRAVRPTANRNADIVAELARPNSVGQRTTCAAIARKYGLTRERVRQIVMDQTDSVGIRELQKRAIFEPALPPDFVQALAADRLAEAEQKAATAGARSDQELADQLIRLAKRLSKPDAGGA